MTRESAPRRRKCETLHVRREESLTHNAVAPSRERLLEGVHAGVGDLVVVWGRQRRCKYTVGLVGVYAGSQLSTAESKGQRTT